MTKNDLRVGMVVAIKNNAHDYFLAAVATSKAADVCISSEHEWYPIDCLNDDLRYCDDEIIEVWDIAAHTRFAHKLSTEDRKLLWKRKKEHKELTVADIEKLLGFPVKIVKE